MRKFVLPYHISNNGDGSASVHFHATIKDAEKAEAGMNEPWGEDCASSKDLYLDENGLFFNRLVWDSKNRRFNETKVYLQEGSI